MMTRREFIKLCLSGLAGMTLTEVLLPQVAEALAQWPPPRPKVIYLEGSNCGGNLLSLANTVKPGLAEVLQEIIDLCYDNALAEVQGKDAASILEEAAGGRLGPFLLVVEGTIPTRYDGRSAVVARKADGTWLTALEAVQKLGPRAEHVIAFGSCASFGGPFAADPNPTGSKPVSAVLDRRVINVSGCPAHPDWLVGTITHLLLYGPLPLDGFGRPVLFYGRTAHSRCPRRALFDQGIFATEVGGEGCLFKVGCKGPVSHCDSPLRQWHGYWNWTVENNAPCIGCTEPGFPDRFEPFFNHLPSIHLPNQRINADHFGILVGGVVGTTMAAHLLGNIFSGRLPNRIKEGLKPEGNEGGGITLPDDKWRDMELATLVRLEEKVEDLQEAVKRVETFLSKKHEAAPVLKKPRPLQELLKRKRDDGGKDQP